MRSLHGDLRFCFICACVLGGGGGGVGGLFFLFFSFFFFLFASTKHIEDLIRCRHLVTKLIPCAVR